MMDRYEVPVIAKFKQPVTTYDQCASGPTDPCLLEWEQGRGVDTTNGISVAAFVKSDPQVPVRDLSLVQIDAAFQGYYPGFEKAVVNPSEQTWLVLKVHNKNRAGTVKLRSKDARDTPLINFHQFEEGTDTAGEDLKAVVAGVQLVRKINALVSDLAEAELIPGPSVQSEAAIATFVRNEAWGHHASCSNHMGTRSDPMAVVDSNFKVFGTRNLRIVDASVFPRIPGYFITVPIQMISEKASDVILAHARAQRHA